MKMTINKEYTTLAKMDMATESAANTDMTFMNGCSMN